MSALHPVDPEDLAPGVPLADNLYNRQGVLIAARGSVIDDPRRLAQLAGQGIYRRQDAHGTPFTSPLEKLQDLGSHYSHMLEDPAGLRPEDIERVARGLRLVMQAYPELGIGMALRLTLPSASQRHSLFVAMVATLLARNLDLGEGAEQAVACAALTMNLSSHALQDTLTCGVQPDADQHRLLRSHPADSAQMLLDAGVGDPVWLQSVLQHHENLDGSGYPRGLHGEAILPEARVLRAADVWCALAAHRHNRIGRYPNHALRVLFQRERGRLDDAVVLALRKLMGRYPPGTLVRLANRETALVTRWFANRSNPDYVVSLLRPSGDALRWPERRHTGRRFHAIRDYTYLPERHAPVDWDRVWAVA